MSVTAAANSTHETISQFSLTRYEYIMQAQAKQIWKPVGSPPDNTGRVLVPPQMAQANLWTPIVLSFSLLHVAMPFDIPWQNTRVVIDWGSVLAYILRNSTGSEGK